MYTHNTYGGIYGARPLSEMVQPTFYTWPYVLLITLCPTQCHCSRTDSHCAQAACEMNPRFRKCRQVITCETQHI